MITKKNISKLYFLFLVAHFLLWTLAPTLTNVNLPLDTIEALAWSSDIDWGFSKHPPLSAFAVEVIYQIFGNQDWAYYSLSQVFVVMAFIAIFNFAKEFFNNINYAFFSILLLEGILFYNYTTPEFNVNISQLPFWSLSILFTWRCIKHEKISDYLCLGLFMGLGFLSKYLFIYLIIGIKLFFIYLLFNKKIKTFKFLITSLVALLIVSPHLIWLMNNDFVTLAYGVSRTNLDSSLWSHFLFPIIFIIKQIGILLPFFLLSFFLVKKIFIRKIIIDEKITFILFIFILPILLMILTSVIMGAEIRTMWMTPFYLLAGVSFVLIYKKNIETKNFKKFIFTFFILFFLSPITYMAVSLINDTKRTDYPGKEIARLVQNKWDDNFYNDIKFVIGDEWFAGNLSYHLNSRPKWMIELKEKTKNININDGVIYTGNPKILKKICPGVFGTIKPVGYCMIGQN